MACPACGRRGLFPLVFAMTSAVPAVDRVQRSRATWIGAIGINTLSSVSDAAGVVAILSVIITYPTVRFRF